ncbi:hypothetical protein N7493_011327 [Penicillium malachiteum]|uniref:Uncharacterized protein n=1 Tax=Penicillium malachiteum TaxID=1324776 RepID=A0AAD6HC14_9EURO|nr:hypothetical protein N7493_011327 [Penicillium malachiteum]
MAEQPRNPNSSVLGESWVMASTASIREKDPKQQIPCIERNSERLEEPASPTPRPKSARNKDSPKTIESISSLTSSSSLTMSGPELIMPSIYEVPISEASWVAPGVRSKDQSSMRKRRKISPSRGKEQGSPTISRNHDAGSSVPIPPKPTPSLLARLIVFLRDQTAVRTLINGILIGFILHLLVLPEVIYQVQDLCQIPVVKTVYPASCIHIKPQTHPFLPLSSASIISPEDTIITSQKDLESIFETTLQTLSPLSNILKESESMLEDLQYKLQSTFPDARNALDLEFQGSDQALRAAAWEFDSIRADLRSAIDSLLSSTPTQEQAGPASIARDTRLAAQIRLRAEYLDRLRSQIRSKADSLGARFSTLDDHLEAVDGIVAREKRRNSLMGSMSGLGGGAGAGTGVGASMQAVLHSLSSYASFWSGSTDDSSVNNGDADAEAEVYENPQPVTTLASLRLAATHHRPVADSVARLSRQLRDVQRTMSGSSW